MSSWKSSFLILTSKAGQICLLVINAQAALSLLILQLHMRMWKLFHCKKTGSFSLMLNLLCCIAMGASMRQKYAGKVRYQRGFLQQGGFCMRGCNHLAMVFFIKKEEKSRCILFSVPADLSNVNSLSNKATWICNDRKVNDLHIHAMRGPLIAMIMTFAQNPKIVYKIPKLFPCGICHYSLCDCKQPDYIKLD